MTDVDIASARAGLSSLVERVAGGESFTLTRYGKPVARLVPVETAAELPAEQRATSAWVDRNPKQAATDAILSRVRKPKRG